MSASQPPIPSTRKVTHFICSRECLRQAMTKLWLWELWQESRGTFKLLISDTIFFLCLLAIITFGHKMIEPLPVSQERRHLLENGHFATVVAAWVFLSLTFIAEIAVATWKRLKLSVQKDRNTHV